MSSVRKYTFPLTSGNTIRTLRLYMKKRKLIFLSGAIWELLRFFLLFFFILVIMNPELQPVSTVLLVWLGSGHLILCLLFFIVWLDLSRYSLLIPVLTVIKGVNLLPPILFFLFGTSSVSEVFSQEYFGFLFLTAGIVLFFDLIFFLILLSFTMHKEKPLPDPERNLPEWTDTKVED